MTPNKTILDSLEEIKKIDLENVLGSVEALSEQCLHAWEEAEKVEIPDSYKDVDSLVMCGMGGSGLGARVIESVFGKSLKIPLVRVNDYKLPEFVDEKTLVFCSSYSGTTEETIANAKEAIVKKAKWMAIGTGSSLIDLAKKEGAPFYQIVAKYNPSNQPRMAIGYSVMGQIVMVSKCGLLSVRNEEVQSLVSGMGEIVKSSAPSVPRAENKTKKLALALKDKIICLISAEHLVGATHAFNNQLNENSKVFTGDYIIPELNHHLMEGLKHPTSNKETLSVIFIESANYSGRTKERLKITKDVVSKNGIKTHTLNIKGARPLTESFELIQTGAFVNFYLAILYGQNPAPIPWVDYFKEKLGQPLGK